MTLDEAIKHCKEVADTCENKECSIEHEQLAEWLKELKTYKNKRAIKCKDIIDKHVNRNGKL